MKKVFFTLFFVFLITGLVGCNDKNIAPVANNATKVTNEDTELIIDIKELISDDNGDSLTVTAISTNGTVNVDETVITFIPTPEFIGDAVITYTVSDSKLTDNGEILVTVKAVNNAPIASNTTFIINEDTEKVMDVSGLISDDDGDSLTVTATSTNGTVSIDETFITFTPLLNFNGDAVITYKVSDNLLSDTGTIIITVNEVNDAPIASNTTFIINEDTEKVIHLSELVGDEDGDSLTVTATSTSGTVSVDETIITFTPALNFNRDAVITYTVSDSLLTDVGTIIITVNAVNDAPNIREYIENQQATEDNLFIYKVPENTFSDEDDEDVLTLNVISSLPSWITFNNITNTFSGTPLNEDVGSFDITVEATDENGGKVTDTFKVIVDNTNDVPIANDSTSVTSEDKEKVINILDLISDEDGDSLIVTATSTNGTVTIDGTFITFTPLLNFSGEALITYTVSDTILSDIKTITVTVIAENDSPVINKEVDDQEAIEERFFIYAIPENTFIDVEDDSLTLSVISTLPSWLTFDNITNTFSGTPLNEDIGSVDVTIEADDSQGGKITHTFKVTVLSKGTGTQDDPFKICSIEDLDNIRNNLSAYYVLIYDLDFTNPNSYDSKVVNTQYIFKDVNLDGIGETEGWIPLGDFYTSFTGDFNGNDHSISNLYINRPTINGIGLFGYNSGANIRNVKLLDMDVTGSYFVGGLVGYSDNSIITNSFVSGGVTGTEYVGGIVGYNYLSTITNTYTTGSVIGKYSVGGLVGNNSSSTISDSFSIGNIIGENFVGGLVGKSTGYSTITKSYTTGSVIGNYTVGGLVGNNSSSTITKSFAIGNITGENSVGGLVGESTEYSTITNSYATGSIMGNYSVGGLVGYNTSSTITNTYTIGSVTGFDFVGGLVGENTEDSTITNSYATGSAKGDNKVGGLVGYNTSSTITESYATGDVTGQNSVGGLVGESSGYLTIIDPIIKNSYSTGSITGNESVGGLVGYNTSSTITESYATGSAKGDKKVGGLVGYNTSSTITESYAIGSVDGYIGVGGLIGVNENSSTINIYYATGNVTGSDFVGGLIGYNTSSTITNSYAVGNVTGFDSVGGLVGYSENSSTITNSYATGNIDGTKHVGGLVGGNYSATITNSYVTGSVTGNNYVGGLVGINTLSTITNSYRYENQSVLGDNQYNTGINVSLTNLQDPNWYTNSLLWSTYSWDFSLINNGYHPHVKAIDGDVINDQEIIQLPS